MEHCPSKVLHSAFRSGSPGPCALQPPCYPALFATSSSPYPILFFYRRVSQRRGSCCNVFRHHLPVGGFNFIFICLRQRMGDPLQPGHRGHCASIVLVPCALGTWDSTCTPAQGHLQRVFKSLCSTVQGALFEGGFCCILSSANSGDANVTCASSEHTGVNLSSELCTLLT